MSLIRNLFARQAHDRERLPSDGVPLRRVLGVKALIAVGLGTMLGGIFTTVGTGAHAAGPAVIAAFGLSGVTCFFVALCYAELASMVPVAGSAYTYAYAALGEVVAWVIGWDLILEYGISVAPLAATFSGALQQLMGRMGVTLPAWAQTANIVAPGGALDFAHSQVDLLAFLTIVVLSVILSIGIRESAATNVVLVVVQLVALFAFVGGVAGAIHPHAYHPFAPLGLGGIVTGAAAVFFAYIGFDTVTVASEEAVNPQRDVPRAIIGSLVIGAVLFSAVAAVAVGVVAWDKIDTNSGLLDAVTHAGNNPWLFALVLVGTVTGTSASMLISLLGQVRIFYVMSRDRLLPPAFGAVNARTRTPLIMTMSTGIVVAVLALGVPLSVLLEFVNIGTLSAFVIVCAGVMTLRFTHPEVKRPFRVPFGPIAVPAIGIALCTWLTVGGLAPLTWLRFAIWFLVGVAIYALYGYRKSALRKA
ncbi:MAG: Amino acid transporter [Candidatus Eremiobacteraeota bacterium]|nr:Amino acid transporter [Candidatus Eremiobacteraeota bacterium]